MFHTRLAALLPPLAALLIVTSASAAPPGVNLRWDNLRRRWRRHEQDVRL